MSQFSVYQVVETDDSGDPSVVHHLGDVEAARKTMAIDALGDQLTFGRNAAGDVEPIQLMILRTSQVDVFEVKPTTGYSVTSTKPESLPSGTDGPNVPDEPTEDTPAE